MNVLAVDPGPTTGVAEWAEEHRAWAWEREVVENFLHQWLVDSVALFGRDETLVVFEGFTITAQTLKKSRDGQVSIEMIGVGRYLCRRYGVRFEVQSPSDAFSFASNDKLKALGWKTPGPGDHAKSASKHLLLALTRHRAIDLAALARGVGVGLNRATG